MGRAARRRKAKAKSIDQAVEAVLRGETIEEEHLPTDRSQPLPGVLIRRKEKQVEFDRDETFLVSQLGYMPGNAVGCVGRVSHLKSLYPYLYNLLKRLDAKRNEKLGDNQMKDAGDMPTALQLYPLAIRNIHTGGKAGKKFKSRKRGHEEMTKIEVNLEKTSDGKGAEQTVIEPFPTMIWLTHPVLKTLISQVELGSTDNVTKMQEKLHSKKEYLDKMKLAHESYGTDRWNLLTEDDRDDVTKRKWTEALGNKRGVAGIRNFGSIKCLHTHSAHYLAYLGMTETAMTENLIGKWTLECIEEIAKAYCSETRNKEK
ncbi:hypothetical protein CTEN210_07565 [Chaetoceros tenuissimus]|uniref:DUF501 domain-containing protein n=1 Tax=Chaetoceros tenuissimus TaxID=426638 RepID=A0AAD3CV09_9STRA|nr:hypothetical protein CTEN210_07565 [Chaetoceros tenuissimus]